MLRGTQHQQQARYFIGGRVFDVACESEAPVSQLNNATRTLVGKCPYFRHLSNLPRVVALDEKNLGVTGALAIHAAEDHEAPRLQRNQRRYSLEMVGAYFAMVNEGAIFFKY